MRLVLRDNCGGAISRFLDFILLNGETVAQQASLAAINLSGYSLKMLINTMVDGLAEPILLTTGNGGLVITSSSSSGSNFTINIPSSITASVDPGTYAYDCFMVSPSGVETAILLGTFTFQTTESPVP